MKRLKKMNNRKIFYCICSVPLKCALWKTICFNTTFNLIFPFVSLYMVATHDQVMYAMLKRCLCLDGQLMGDNGESCMLMSGSTTDMSKLKQIALSVYF